MTVVFVTAIYNIHKTRSNEIWERFKLLASTIPIHIVCSAENAELLPAGVTPYYREFEELDTYKALQGIHDLPQTRNTDKDTKEYMILMNAKAEFLQIVNSEVNADHYIWIDAVIGKILSDPIVIFNKIIEETRRPLKADTILIPGCWDFKVHDPLQLTKHIVWRFAGGFFIVPCGYIDPFAAAVLDGCKQLAKSTGKLTWEVNVWCLIEQHLPIQWERADHNDTIISGLANYFSAE
jgi:hypothetical protein